MANKDIIARVIGKAGSMHKLATLLGIKYQAIQRWHQIPTKRILAIEAALDIPREELRPDLYRPREQERNRWAS